MNNLSEKTGGIATGISALVIGLGLLGVTPAEASLIGDEVTLDLEFSSESEVEFGTLTNVDAGFGEDDPSASGGESASVVVQENGSALEGNFAGVPEFVSDGVAFGNDGSGGIGFGGDNSMVQTFGIFNVEGAFIEGEIGVFWQLFDQGVAPFTWEYSFSDLDWTDFPEGKIVGASLGFAEGFGISEVFSGFAEGFSPVDYESLFALDFTDDAVTIALNVDPFDAFAEGGVPMIVPHGESGLISAFGFAEGAFRIDLAVEHGDNGVDVPEPASALGLLLVGGLGLGRRSKLSRCRRQA